MLCPAQTLPLKDGHPCLVRSPRAGDAAAILENLRITSGETDFMLRYPDEIQMGEEEEARFLEQLAGSPGSCMASAFVGRRLVGNAGFDPVARVSRCAHRAVMGISIQKAWWGLGVGSALLAALLAAARQAGYTQLELDVVEENTRGQALYKKFGFVPYGRLPAGMRYRDGREAAMLLMVCPL